jgi:hypothetical protein
MQRLMLIDWRWAWTEAGTLTMLACVAESAWQMGSHCIGRSLHIHLALGLSKGAGLLLIWSIVLAQAAASVALMVPQIYLATGAIVPSGTLAATLWFETLVFGDVADAASALRAASLTLTALMLALFRFDRQARNARAQLPTSGVLLGIEARVRRACTAARTGLGGPVVSILLVGWAIVTQPYWRAHGMTYEFQRGRFHAAAASAALALLVAGQDTRGHVIIGHVLEHMYDRVMKHTERLLGWPSSERPLGAKKFS